MCALKDFHGAKKVLIGSCERDNRSKHKALIRLSKVHYLLGDYQKVMKCGFKADEFFQEKWGNHSDDALFWQAVGAYRLGENDKALGLAMKLKANNPRYDKLNTLLDKLG